MLTNRLVGVRLLVFMLSFAVNQFNIAYEVCASRAGAGGQRKARSFGDASKITETSRISPIATPYPMNKMASKTPLHPLPPSLAKRREAKAIPTTTNNPSSLKPSKGARRPFPPLSPALQTVVDEAIAHAREEQKPERARHSAYGLIIETALKLFAEHSIDRVSIQEIADHAKVSKANVFHHFANKDSLLGAIVQWLARPHAEFAEALFDLPFDSAEKIRALIRYEILLLTENPTLMQFMVQMWSRSHLPDNASEQGCSKAIFQRNIKAVIALFQQGQERGEFRQDLSAFLPAMVLGGMKHLIARNQLMRQLMNTASPLRANCVTQNAIAEATQTPCAGHFLINIEPFIEDFSVFMLSAMRPSQA